MVAHIEAIRVKVEEDSTADWHDFLGGEEFGGPDNTKRMEEQWAAGVRGYYSLIVSVDIKTNSNRIVTIRGLLGGIDLLFDTTKSKDDAMKYLAQEARGIYLHELAKELIKDFHVPSKEVKRAYDNFDWEWEVGK